jgi:AraC-like DNA-binding protein
MAPRPTMHSRPPHPALAPYVERLWHFDDTADHRPRHARERALPTGRMDLVVRLSPQPIRVFGGVGDDTGGSFGHAVIAGARPSYHVRDTSAPSCSVGAHFRPGGAALLLGIPAGELAGRHTALGDLFGSRAARLRERVLGAPSPAARLAVLEAFLLERCVAAPRAHPAVAHALARLGTTGACAIGELCRETGYSQRWLIERFRAAVGLPPKVYARILRFQTALGLAARAPRLPWARLAATCGYSDQAHLSREFQAIAGLTPGSYAPLAGRANHVPIGEPAGSRTFKTAPPAAG